MGPGADVQGAAVCIPMRVATPPPVNKTSRYTDGENITVVNSVALAAFFIIWPCLLSHIQFALKRTPKDEKMRSLL